MGTYQSLPPVVEALNEALNILIFFPDEITSSFRRYGPLIVDWPHKAESKSYFPPKGYAFLLFQVSFNSNLNVEKAVAWVKRRLFSSLRHVFLSERFCWEKLIKISRKHKLKVIIFPSSDGTAKDENATREKQFFPTATTRKTAKEF